MLSLNKQWLIVPLALAALAGFLWSWLAPARGTGATDSLTLYGNVDIREVQLAFQDGGRIRSLFVDEGTRVAKGQVVAELDPDRFRLDLARLSGEVASQQHVLDRLLQGSRTQEIVKARAGVEAAKASLHEAELLFSRKQSLLRTSRISQQEVDSAAARLANARAAARSAEEELSLAMEGPRKEDIAAAESALAALEAACGLAQKRLDDARLVAPSDGIIRTRILEQGAMAGAGAPVLTLALTDPLWVRAYVSEPDLGRIREGMRVQVKTDSYPDKVYEGWVGFVSSTAEFTPKTVETTDLRTKLVYRCRVLVCNPQQELRLGMPVTLTLPLDQPVKPLPAEPCASQR